MGTTSTVSTKCNVCYKMVVSRNSVVSDCGDVHNNTIVNEVKSTLPGLSTASEVKKPIDSNLSPFLIAKSNLIQYGDTSLHTLPTDDPRWSPGECPNLTKYLGQFRIRSDKCVSKVYLKHYYT